jgi:hypothetical protein
VIPLDAALAVMALDIWALHSLTVHVKEPQMIYLNDTATVTTRETQSHQITV